MFLASERKRMKRVVQAAGRTSSSGRETQTSCCPCCKESEVFNTVSSHPCFYSLPTTTTCSQSSHLHLRPTVTSSPSFSPVAVHESHHRLYSQASSSFLQVTIISASSYFISRSLSWKERGCNTRSLLFLCDFKSLFTPCHSLLFSLEPHKFLVSCYSCYYPSSGDLVLHLVISPSSLKSSWISSWNCVSFFKKSSLLM